MAQYCCTCWRL